MKLQHLAIIFVIIILPISMVISSYIQTQIDAINVQNTYSLKLQNATYDAMIAFRLNTINNKYSTVSDSKIRDIEASIETFYDSVSVGESYTKEEMEDFVPAILYTMYDGYYIYGRYLNENTQEYQNGLKPFNYYSCRYKKGNSIDIVVNYTLDNYITVFGTVKGQYVAVGGYVLNPYKVTNAKKDEYGNIVSIKYADTEIVEEILQEQLIILDNGNNASNPTNYDYTMIDSNKIYYDGQNYFMYNNYKKQIVKDEELLTKLTSMTKGGHLYDNSAVMYYYEGYRFSYWLETYLGSLTQQDAVDEQGNKITDFNVNTGTQKIFNYKGVNSTEYTTFNENRMCVIRRSIESNLKTAIASYNENFRNSYYFVLPKIDEVEWEKILNNVSIVTFMQGIPIGTKYFNDYCVMTNNQNKEVVTPDTLYAITDDGEIHRLGCKDVIENKKTITKIYKNIDFERQTVKITENNEVYFYPHANTRCYNCLVNQGTTYSVSDMINMRIKVFNETTKEYEYVASGKYKENLENFRVQLLTALARESYMLYKVNDYFKNPEALLNIAEITEEVVNLRVSRIEWQQDPSGMGINRATAYLKKAASVSDTLKPQYQINPDEESINDPTKWITGTEIQGLHHGDKIYIRLFNETYSGDYSMYTVLDKLTPSMPQIKVVNGASEFNNYFNKQVDLIIEQGIDKETGTDHTTYKLEGKHTTNGQEVNYIPGSKISITEEGTTIITAYSYDKVGNRSVALFVVNKDESKPGDPTLEVVKGTLGNNGYYRSNVEVKAIMGADNGPSGILEMRYSTVGQIIRPEQPIADGTIITLDEDGETLIIAYMKDKAGNVSDGKRLTIKIDTVNPEIVQGLTESDKTTRSVIVNLKVKDVTSGIDKIVWEYYKKDLGEATKKTVTDTYSGQTTVQDINKEFGSLQYGEYIVKATIYDRAGGYTTTDKISVFPKQVPKAVGATWSPKGYTNGNVTVTLPDKSSEGLTTQYREGSSGTWKNYSSALSIDSNKTIYYRYTDGINTQTDSYASININNIDKKAIVVTENITRTAISATSFTTSIKVNEDYSGVATINWYYRIKNSGNGYDKYFTDQYKTVNGTEKGLVGDLTYTCTFNSIQSGKLYEVYAEIIDVAGNKTTSNVVEIQTDSSADKEAIIVISGDKTQSSKPIKLKATITIDDSLSGIDVSSSKWVLDKTQIHNKDASKFTNTFTSSNQTIDLSMNSKGIWYLHVLTVDKVGNTREDVASITITVNYHTHKKSCYTNHTHTGDSENGGGCYGEYVVEEEWQEWDMCTNCGEGPLAHYEGNPFGACSNYNQWKGYYPVGYHYEINCGLEEGEKLTCKVSLDTIENYTISY